MNRSAIFALSTVLSFLTLAGCGSSPSPTVPENVPPPAPSASSVPDVPSVPSAMGPIKEHSEWKAMNDGQRKAYMKNVVMPRMKEIFAEYDGKRYAEVTCKTCHGPGAEKGQFHMPSKALAELDPKGDFKKHTAKDAKMVEFMMKRVVPEMAKLMAEEVYNRETKKGFGCHECHSMAK